MTVRFIIETTTLKISIQNLQCGLLLQRWISTTYKSPILILLLRSSCLYLRRIVNDIWILAFVTFNAFNLRVHLQRIKSVAGQLGAVNVISMSTSPLSFATNPINQSQIVDIDRQFRIINGSTTSELFFLFLKLILHVWFYVSIQTNNLQNCWTIRRFSAINRSKRFNRKSICHQSVQR